MNNRRLCEFGFSHFSAKLEKSEKIHAAFFPHAKHLRIFCEFSRAKFVCKKFISFGMPIFASFKRLTKSNFLPSIGSQVIVIIKCSDFSMRWTVVKKNFNCENRIFCCQY